MVQVLEAIPSFGQQLARGLGAGIGSGVSQATQQALQLMGERRKTLAKNVSDIDSFIHKKLKDKGYKSWLDNPKKKAALKEIYGPLVKEGHDPEEAFEHALNQYQGAGKKGISALPGEKGKETSGGFPSLSSVIQATGLRGDNQLWDFLTKERGNIDPTSGEDISGGKSPGRPDIAAKILPASLANIVEQGLTAGLLPLAQQKSPRLSIEQLLSNKEPWKADQYFKTPGQHLSEKIMEGMTPEERQKAQESEAVQSLALGAVAPELGVRAFKGIKGLRGKKPKVGPVPEEPISPLAAEAEAAAQDVKQGLQGRVSKEIAETPTEMRVSRTKPETRLYNRLENVKLRENQVKLFPQYESEIAADASARAAREEARRPKTALGEASQAARMAEGEKHLPAVRKAYENSIGRVRALEDEVARLTGTQRETAETLLELAQRDLENAEFELIQTMNNARTGDRRVGIPQMEKAAQEKMIKIGDQIANGEEVKLAKMDYSPDMIAEANRLSKSKKLPARRTDDYYTRVHDAYANQYKSRLAQIENEIQAAMKDKGLASLYQRQQLGKEKEALNKMIKSAEAENAIHRHKIGLREISNRHRAQERFGRLRKAEGGEKTAQVAREKMWKDQIQEATSPQERARVFEEGIEQAAAENPKHAEQIKKEGSGLHEAFEKVKAETENLNASKVKEAPNAQEAAKRAKNGFNRFVNNFKDLKSNFPYIWRTQAGRDFITGITIALVDEGLDLIGIELPIGTSTLASIILGRSGGARAGFRVAGNSIAKAAVREWKIHNAKKYYEGNSMEDEEKFSSYSPSIRKQAAQRAS